MFHIGIDLAWGTRRPTGLAVLDDDGRLREIATARTDEEILALVAPYAAGPCVVGIDAPLVVTNPTGNRPAERALNADFARFDAGAHPTNTGKAEFAEGSRGGRLVEALGLDLESGPRRALEVYPHAATVALFRLGRTLKYKQKTGRDLDQLRGELLVLMGRLEGLHDADPALHLGAGDVAGPWRVLRRQVEQASRKSELRVVEDQVDAVVCAYVARFTAHRPDDVTSYGDPGTGVIVTPTLPPDLVPTPRRAGQAEDVPPDPIGAVAGYALRHPRLLSAESVFRAQVTSVLDDAGVDYLSVTSRTKTVASYAEKAARLDADGRLLHTDPGTQITDALGLRVITYVRDDVTAVAELLHDQVGVVDDRDWGRETASQGRFGYASRHLLVTLGPDVELSPEHEPMRGLVAQVQIRTVLQHAWAEFEHDIRYKGTVPEEHASDFDRRFTLAAGLLELADQEFSTIRETLRSGATSVVPLDSEHSGIAPRELAAFLAGQYADAGWSRSDHYDWMTGLVTELGIDSLAELADTLRTVDEGLIALRMEYRYPPGAVRRLDDALLLARGLAYVELRGNAHRADLLRARWLRLGGQG